MASELHFSKVFQADTPLYAAELNQMQLEAQARLEQRSDDLAQDCVLTAADWEPSLSGMDTVAFAAGTLYFRGKRYSGPASYLFAAEAVGSYYVYLDDVSEEIAVSVVAPLPTAGFRLCRVSWDGVALSSLADLRVVGPVGAGQIAPGSVGLAQLDPSVAGALGEVTEVGGSFQVTGEVGDVLEACIAHGAGTPENTVFATPLEFRSAGPTGVRITPIAQMSDGRQSDGSQQCVLIEILG